MRHVAGLEEFIAQNMVVEGRRDTHAAKCGPVGLWRREAWLRRFPSFLAEPLFGVCETQLVVTYIY